MVCCCAFGCSHNKNKKTPGITFHRFPKNPERRAAWTKAVRRENWTPSAASVICSEHFRPEDIDRTSLSVVRIRDNAVPTIFPAHPPHLKKAIQSRKPPVKRSFVKMDNPSEPTSSGVHNKEDEAPMATSQLCISLVCRNMKLELARVTAAYKAALKKIKVLQQKNRRYGKRKAKMLSVIKALQGKHYVEESKLNILEGISGSCKSVLERVVRKVNEESTSIRYDSQLRDFALTLHFYSPRAYKFVRNNFYTCLPHTRTIGKWYRNINGNPGITEESLNILKNKAQNSTSTVWCNLVIDEMAIRQHVEWDGKRYYGYVDFGSAVEDDSMHVAKEVFVVMLVCISQSWKLPVAYVFTDGLSGEQKANIIRQVLLQINDTGVKICSLTFDGAASNLSMARILGCKVGPKEFSTSFAHPITKDPIFIFLDPSHMIKLVRNTLGDKKILLDGEKGAVKWEYLESLKALQDSEGLHLANKMRTAHLQWRRQKMKVKLATQVLSDSVADAIELCEDLGIPSFFDSKALCTFLRIFNRLFDIMNSRNILQREWKKPICPSNIEEIKEFLMRVDSYIMQLTDAEGNAITSSNRKTGFVGFQVSIKSLLGLSEFLLGRAGEYEYITTYKLSQDHLELFFSSIRSQGGHNNNPTARQFQAAYKKLLIHCQVMEVSNGNCVPLDDVQILQVSSATSPISIINRTTTGNDIARQYVEKDSHFPMVLPDCISEVAEDIIKYIAGFVVRKIRRSIDCVPCTSALVGNESDTDCSLITKKNRGGLVVPSKDVILICRISEKWVRRSLHRSNSVLRIISSVMEEAGHLNVFPCLEEHSYDQIPGASHWVQLIRAVANEYAQIRFHYSAKLLTESLQQNKVRHIYNKITLFRGQ